MNTDTCAKCSNRVESVDGVHWVHSHADKDEYCGTGDGSTAYSKTLWEIHQAELRAREGRA